MEKRLASQGNRIADTKSVDQKLSKIKQALNNVNWDYGTLFEDLNGFIESHEESSSKIKAIQDEKQKVSHELQKSEQKIQALTKKFQEYQGEVGQFKQTCQLKINELLNVKKTLSEKIEALNHNQSAYQAKIEELNHHLRKKEETFQQNKLHIEKTEAQVETLNKAFAERVHALKIKTQELVETKETELETQLIQFNADKENLQKKIQELRLDNHNLKEDIQLLKDRSVESKNSLENVTHQKNQLIKKSEDALKFLKLAQAKISQLEIDLKIKSQKEIALESSLREIQKDIESKNQDIHNLTTSNADWKTKHEGSIFAHQQDRQKFQTDRNNLESTIIKTTDEKKVLEQQLNSLGHILNELKVKFVQKKEENIVLNQTIENLKQVEVKYKQTTENLLEEKLKNQSFLKKLETALSRIQNLETDNQTILQTKFDLEAELNQKIQNLNELIEDQKSTITIRLNEIQTLETKNKEYETLNLDLNKQNDLYIYDLEVLKKDLSVSEKKNEESQIQISVLNDEKNNLSLEIHEQLRRINTLDNETETLNGNLIEEQNLVSELKQQKSTLEMHLEDQQKKNKSLELNFIEAKNELENQISSLNLKKQSLDDKISEQKDLIQEHIQTIDQIKSDKVDLLNQNLKLDEDFQRLKIKFDERSTEFQAEKLKIEALEKGLEQKRSEINDLNNENDNLNLEIKEAHQNLQTLSFEKDEFGFKVNQLGIELADLNDRALNEKKIHFEQMQEMDKNLETLRQEKECLQNSEATLKQQVHEKELHLLEQQERIQNLTNQVSVLNAEAEDSALRVVNLEAKEIELSVQIRDLESKNSDLSFKVVQAGEKYDEGYKQKQSLEMYIEENKDLYAVVKKKHSELEMSLDSLRDREEKLNLFSRWMDSQKEGIQKQVLRIASELRATKDFNPLSPYLKMTEREIAKIEVMMTKSNVFGPQRLQLERQYEQLVKQRDEVHELLVKTNLEVDEKAKVLLAILKTSEFIPVPPLPPGTVIEATPNFNEPQ